MLIKPVFIKLCNHSSNIQEVTVMEMVIVVISVAKIDVSIRGSGFVDDAAPGCFESRGGLGR